MWTFLHRYFYDCLFLLLLGEHLEVELHVQFDPLQKSFIIMIHCEENLFYEFVLFVWGAEDQIQLSSMSVY
jgi:hypothetical protein